MCGLCGALGGQDWTEGPSETAAAVAHRRRAARRRLVASANRVLRHAGMQVAEWQGSALLLRSRTGATSVLQGAPALWPAADRMASPRLDPLDPALLAALERD